MMEGRRRQGREAPCQGVMIPLLTPHRRRAAVTLPLIIAVVVLGNYPAAAASADHLGAILSSNPLRNLPRLPRPHFSWPFPQVGATDHPGLTGGYLGNASEAFLDGFMHDYVRITGACPLGLTHTSQREVMTCAKLCAARAIVPTGCIVINYSPWYAKFPSHDPTVGGSAEAAEMTYFTGLLGNVSRWLAEAARRDDGAAAAAAAGVGAVLLDQEKFSASPSSPFAALTALTRKCDLIYNASVRVFPAARVEWCVYSCRSLRCLAL
jgi:hypothetical protein